MLGLFAAFSAVLLWEVPGKSSSNRRVTLLNFYKTKLVVWIEVSKDTVMTAVSCEN